MMLHDSQGPYQRRKRPLPKLPHRSASGQFISVGPCWISTSHSSPTSWYGDTTLCEPTGFNKKVHDSKKMETHLPSSDYQGIHQKPYEPTTSTSSSSASSSASEEDRSNCTSPLDFPHTPEDPQYQDATFLKRYSSPLYPLSHRHSMLLTPTGTIRDALLPLPQPPQRAMTPTRRAVSTIDLKIPSPWLDTFTQTPNEISEEPPEVTPSFSLTHDKDALATYRRMATKTKHTGTQLSYMMYLIQVAGLYRHQKRGDLRLRLLQEAGYWLRRLAKSRSVGAALVMKGRWYLQQADPAVPLDDLNLMMLASSPTDRPQREKARQCFQHAVKLGSVEAHYELAMLVAAIPPRKRGTKTRNCQIVMASLGFAADQDHRLACFKLANIYLFGEMNQAQDLGRGLYYLEKAVEEEGSSVSAQAAFMLSCLYAGDHTLIGLASTKLAVEGIKNPSQARHYLDRAVALHYPEALLRMGQLYESGKLGLPENKWQAFQWYLQAPCAGGMLEVARCYANGIPGHLASNPTLAFQWCQRASDHGLDQADYLLGTWYEAGFGVAPDYPKALACYDKAASKGYSPLDSLVKKQDLINCTIM